MSHKEIKEFYSDFAGDKYLTEIRRFGLRYDEMVDSVVDLLVLNNPKEVLDIGCGIGNVEENILERIPKAKITCVEISPEMIEVAKKRIGKKVNLINKDIMRFEPKQNFDAIFSNLTIHNLPLKEKKVLLNKIKKWLKPEGVFVWGDFMDWEDKNVAKYFMDYRKEQILKTGVSKKLVQEVFAKEEKDPRLTVIQTIDLLRESGFEKPEVIWVYSFLAVFRAKK